MVYYLLRTPKCTEMQNVQDISMSLRVFLFNALHRRDSYIVMD